MNQSSVIIQAHSMIIRLRICRTCQWMNCQENELFSFDVEWRLLSTSSIRVS